jgi:hypothetical protein
MPYAAFYQRFPKIAEHETRNVKIVSENQYGLPIEDYGFLEFFCDEPGCDCRRVFLYVISSRRGDMEAVIAYGWESRGFYAKWMRSNDKRDMDELQGPALNLLSPQSKIAPALLDLFKDVLLHDRAYIDRIKEHYRIFRAEIDCKSPAKDARSKEKRI